MLYRERGGAHVHFDYAAAARVFSSKKITRLLGGEMITSPWDIFAVETLRDQCDLRRGRALPSDLLLFGKGEPTNPASTKVGGRPYWPRTQPWPTTKAGLPYRFLAQFNFLDSGDILPSVPEAVLVILTAPRDDWLTSDDGLSFHWIAAGCDRLSDLPVSCTFSTHGAFFGALHRSCDYPDAISHASACDVPRAFLLPVLHGTKIGGVPSLLQGGEEMQHQFLCQLGSIQAAPRIPYPWVNDDTPLGLRYDDGKTIHDKDNCIVFHDMGSFYFFLDSAGSVTWLFQSF